MSANSSTTPRQPAHPTPARYTAIAVVLAVITIIEVAIVYQEFLRPVLLPILLILSAAKFAVVAMFYMHLRFDDRLFSIFFVVGLVLATFVLIALLILFRVFIS